MTTDNSLPLTVRRIAFRRLAGFSSLFTDYCERFDRLAPYFAADYRSFDSVRAQVNKTLGLDRDRALLAEVLLEQNERWGLDDSTRRNINRLAAPDSVAVVTGQQVGLFGGPLYTMYKTATTIRLAEEWSRRGVSAVPVFWLEGEDHDVEEVRRVGVLGGSGPFSAEYDPGPQPSVGNRGPVGRLTFGDSIVETIDRLDAELPSSEFHDGLIRTLREIYRPGVTFRDAFARFLKHLFPASGLVFLSADDLRLKKVAVPLFARELGASEDIARAVEEVSLPLEREYHAQVTVRPTNLFYIDEKGRSAIDISSRGDGYSIRNHDRLFGREELVRMLEEDPCAFSPNVVLRPILQDTLLPTLAYVAGPGEVAYLAQFKPVYEWTGVPMPIVYPRASVTFVEARIEKLLDRYELDVTEVGLDIEMLLKQVVLGDMADDVPGRFQQAGSMIDSAVDEVRDIVVRTDPTLEKALGATRANLVNELSKLQGRVLRAEKRRHEDDRRRLERIRDNLFPAGRPQERSLSSLSFLNKYGSAFVEGITSALSTDTSEHQIVVVSP